MPLEEAGPDADVSLCRVFLHCVAGRSRTPTVAATYLADRDGIGRAEALQRLRDRLPDVRPNPRFRRLLDGRGAR